MRYCGKHSIHQSVSNTENAGIESCTTLVIKYASCRRSRLQIYRGDSVLLSVYLCVFTGNDSGSLVLRHTMRQSAVVSVIVNAGEKLTKTLWVVTTQLLHVVIIVV